MSNQLEKIKELIERRATARMGGGDKAIAKQHDKGKYTARERIAMLLDEGSSKKWICLWNTDAPISAWRKKHLSGRRV
mgnify:CR=1 FL=1